MYLSSFLLLLQLKALVLMLTNWLPMRTCPAPHFASAFVFQKQPGISHQLTSHVRVLQRRKSPLYKRNGALHAIENEDMVVVSIRRTFPKVNPRDARDAWITYHWKQGGGLPIIIQSYNSTSCDVFERTIFPVLMKETLQIYPCGEDASFTQLEYKVSEAGPIYQDVIKNSHNAVVTFSSNKEENECEMVWNVTFSTSKWRDFYTAMTQFLVGTSANTVQEALSSPRVFKMSSTINDYNMNARSAFNTCLEFVWMNGGGLPLPPPISYGQTLKDSMVRKNLLRIPPLITESIIETLESDTMAGFDYTLNRPGWLTFPFLMHTHRGKVRFRTVDDNSLSISWDIEIRPFKVAAPLVEKLVEMTVTTLLRNLRVHIIEPGATVVIKPPRGNADLLIGRKSFGSVAKDTWLGGVLDAHLADDRSTLEQSLATLQPWTWGRTGSGDKDDTVRFQWSDS